MNIKTRLIRIAAIVFSGGILMMSPAAYSTPTLNLFPTSVVENLQASAQTAKNMESSMETVIVQLENQMALYKDSKCDSSDTDAGCAEIKKGISRTYGKMLDEMEQQLPEIKQAMLSTEKTLGRNIRSELGKKMTPLDLQRLVQGKKDNAQSVRRISGKRQGRMSKMLSQYHSMIALSNNQGQSQAMLAAEIYTDAAETLDYIALLESEISRSKGISAIGEIWNGEPSDEMVATVNSVKTLLFGDQDQSGIPDVVQNRFQNHGVDDSDWVIE